MRQIHKVVRLATGGALVAVLAVLATASTAGAGGGGGGATTDESSGDVTMHLVATNLALHTNSGDKSPAADVYAYKDRLTTPAGTPVGEDHCFCVALDSDDMVCDGVLALQGGSLTFTQPYSNARRHGTGSITGGTGRYTGAAGTFTAVGRAGTGTPVYDYYLRFRPRGDDQ